jgi:hypothetical protein
VVWFEVNQHFRLRSGQYSLLAERLLVPKCILMYAFNFSEQQHLEVEFIAILSALLRIILEPKAYA